MTAIYQSMFRFGLLLLLALSSVQAFGQVDSPSSPVQLNKADYLTGHEQTLIPSPEDSWQATRLPFSQAGGDQRQWLWFRLPVDTAAEAEALYIQNHVFSIAVYLNGEYVGGRHRNDGRQAMGWNHPLFIRLPAPLWQASGNVLHVRLETGVPNAILSPLLLGNGETLQALWQQRTFQQVTVAEWNLMACLLMGVLTFSLWLMRRRDHLYLIFATTCFSWSLVMSYLALPFAPIEHSIWLRLGYFCVDVAGCSVVLLINRLMAYPHQRMERYLLLVLVVSGLAIASMDIHWHSVVTSITHGIQLLFVGFVLLKTLYCAMRYRQAIAIYISVGLGLMAVIMLRDIWVFWQAYQQPERLPDSTWMQYGFGFLLLLIFIHLIRTFVDALNQAEHLNAELELRVQQASQSLEQSYAENRALEMDATAQNERQRIYRDLHDDVGAKLVSIIHSQQEGNSTELAREALVSLREVVAQNSFQYRELDVLMVSCASEMELRLNNASIELTMMGVEDLPNIALATDVGYHINRIFRELVSNIIKHAQARHVAFNCHYDGRQLSCELQDDGIGFDVNMLQGSGLSNIRHRAQEIGAQVTWKCSEGGCVTQLILPLYSAAD